PTRAARPRARMRLPVVGLAAAGGVLLSALLGALLAFGLSGGKALLPGGKAPPKSAEVPTSEPKPEPVPALPKAADFGPLFNGRDLADWEALPQQMGDWRVVNNILVGRGPAISHLFHKRVYADVHVRADLRINAEGNSGVFVRSAFGLGRSGGRSA